MPKSSYWFWAWIRLITVPKDTASRAKRGIVWDNLIIVKADSPPKALLKVEKIGRLSSGNDYGSLRLDGRPAVQKYLGILDMGLIHERLADGCEILFRESRQLMPKAKSKVKTKKSLLDNVQREIAPYLKIGIVPYD